MSPSRKPQEIESVPQLVSKIIELLDPQKIVAVDINWLLQTVINIVFDIRKVKVEDFRLSRAESSIPVYYPGVFPIGFPAIETLRDFTTYTPLVIFANFVITQTGLSRIKAKGMGELSVSVKGKRINVKARNIWSIEEVDEASPQKEAKNLAKKLEKFVNDVLIGFIAKLLAELASKVFLKS